MKSFTYGNYIRCIHTLRLNAVLKLAEESGKYRLNKEETVENVQKIKEILKIKKEMMMFINECLDLKEKVKYNNLERINDYYIKRKYNFGKEKLLYKIINKETFFLLEEVSQLDNIVLYDMLNYCINFMQTWTMNNKIKRENSYPIIIPIIIYTGSEKIKCKTTDNKSIGDYIFKNYNIDLNYNLIDINKIPENTLIKINAKFSNEMLMQKLKNKKESKS